MQYHYGDIHKNVKKCFEAEKQGNRLFCLDIFLSSHLRLHLCLPDGLFPLIVCNCQNYPSLCDLLTILCRAQIRSQ